MSVDRISEDDIPADIVEAAMKACRGHSFGPKNCDGPLSTACLMVARAILAERTRCNEILRAAFGKNVTVETLQALATADAIVASHPKEEAPQ